MEKHIMNSHPTPPRTTEQPGAVSQDCSDAELSAAICNALKLGTYHKPTKEECNSGSYYQWEPDFARSATSVLPLLEKAKHGWDSSWTKGQALAGNYMVRFDGHIGRANTFARAACFALLRAASVTVTGSAHTCRDCKGTGWLSMGEAGGLRICPRCDTQAGSAQEAGK